MRVEETIIFAPVVQTILYVHHLATIARIVRISKNRQICRTFRTWSSPRVRPSFRAIPFLSFPTSIAVYARMFSRICPEIERTKMFSYLFVRAWSTVDMVAETSKPYDGTRSISWQFSPSWEIVASGRLGNSNYIGGILVNVPFRRGHAERTSLR